MKKVLLLLLALFILVPNSTLASVNQGSLIKEKVIFEKEEITDINKIIEMAKNGETDLKDLSFDIIPTVSKEGLQSIDGLSLNEIDLENASEEDFEVFQTTQKLKTTQASNGVTTTDYVTNSVIYYDKSSGTVTDGSYTVRGVVNIRWAEKYESAKMWMKFTSTNGSWTLLDSNFNLSNRNVRYGQVGLEACTTNNCNSTLYPSTNSFTYYGQSSWPWLSKNTNMTSVSSTSQVNVNRGTSTFVFKISVIKHGLEAS